MDSHSDQSSSSGMDSPRRNKDHEYEKNQRDRSRSRDKKYKKTDDRYDDRNRRGSAPRKITIKRPELDSHLMNFKRFQDFQTEKISTERAQKQYDNYKRQWEEHQNKVFFQDHKEDAWFKEKYNPDYVERLGKQRQEKVQARALQFFKNLELGHYDKINLTVEDPPTSLGFISHHSQDEQVSTVVPINNQTIDISLSFNTDVTKEPFYGFDPDRYCIFIKLIPKTVSRNDIYQKLSKLQGFKDLYLSEPVRKYNFARYCWISFENEDSFKNAEVQMSGLIINEEPLSFSPSLSKNKRIKVLKKYPRSRLETDIKTVLKLIQVLDQQNNISDNPIAQMEFSSNQKQFDTCLLYLRRVHAYDYFSGNSFECQRALALKMGLAFLRIQSDYEQIPDFQTVFKKIQEAAEKRAKGNTVEKPDFKNNIKEEIENWILKRQGLGRQDILKEMIWKCDAEKCEKKFKTCEFLAKHIMTKHQQEREKITASMLIKLAYLSDPNRPSNMSAFKQERDRESRGRGRYQNNYGRRQNRRRQFKDWDEPEGEKTEKVIAKPMVNFLDI